MHPYAIYAGERVQVIAALSLISLPVAWGISRVMSNLGAWTWWFDSPAVLGVATLLFWIFDQYVWRWKSLHKVGVVKTPDMNGRWEGHITSSFDNHQAEHPVVVEIVQTWWQISVHLQATSSESWSLIGGISSDAPGRSALTYEYRNEPRMSAVGTMQTHRGTASHVFTGTTLNGTYYNGRGRGNFGEIRLVRARN